MRSERRGAVPFRGYAVLLDMAAGVVAGVSRT